jgi:uncharacterized membrane protein YhaH (DUF805 family)
VAGRLMDVSLFTSFEGRIPRSKFWLGVIILFVVQWIVWMVFAMTFGMEMMAVDPNDPEAGLRMMRGMGLPIIILVLVFLYPALATYTKRWHDRAKSGWWSLILLIPVIGPIWFLVECGCLRGTEGPNEYGPDPLGVT